MAVPVSKTKEQENLASSSSATSEVRNLPVFPPSCSSGINVQQGLEESELLYTAISDAGTVIIVPLQVPG